MANSLRGMRVLIPRGGQWGQRVRGTLETLGAEGIIAPLIETRPPLDTRARDVALARITAGDYAWVFVTSASSVAVLRAHTVTIPPKTRIAAVGKATAGALREAHMPASFVASGQASAASLATQWCLEYRSNPRERLLVTRSDRALTTVSDTLTANGHTVDVCIAYRTVGLELAPVVLDDIREGRIDIVLVTSDSVSRELFRQVKHVPSTLILASLGPNTTRAMTRLGHPPHLTSPSQTVEELLRLLDSL